MSSRRILMMLLTVVFLAVGLIPADVANAEGKPPRFIYSPNIVAPGDSFTVSGTLFDTGNTVVRVSVMDSDGQPTILGFAPLIEGDFSQSFTIPEDLIPGRYLVHADDFVSQRNHRCVGQRFRPHEPVGYRWDCGQ